MCVFKGAQSNPAADARKDEEIRSLQDQLEKLRLDNANKDSAIEKLVSYEIKMFEVTLWLTGTLYFKLRGKLVMLSNMKHRSSHGVTYLIV